MSWIEQVFVPSRRETTLIQVSSVTPYQIEGDPTRVHIRLCMNGFTSMVAGDGCQLQIRMTGIGGVSTFQSIMGTSPSHPVDDLDVEQIGDLITRQLTLVVTGAQDCLLIITTIKRESARLESIGG